MKQLITPEEIKTFEVFTKSFSQIVQGRNFDNALNIFRLQNPKEEVIIMQNVDFAQSKYNEDLSPVLERALEIMQNAKIELIYLKIHYTPKSEEHNDILNKINLLEQSITELQSLLA